MSCNQEEIVLTEGKFLKDLTPLGGGGYGTVFKAYHSQWGVVAFKKLHSQFIKENSELALKREAEIQCQLNHPNIVKFIALTLEPERTGLVFEFMEHGEILDYVENYKPEWGVKLAMIRDITLGMCYLHSLNPPIIHGDLKNENILLSENLTAKICDFGFAQWKNYSQSHSCEKVRIGTVTHIPPETWSDAFLRKTEQFDVYSFGICVWEIITVRKPFEVMIPSVIKETVLANKRPDLKLIPDVVSKRVIKLIEQCWDPISTNRPLFVQIKAAVEAEPSISGKTDSSQNEQRPKPDDDRLPENITTINFRDLFVISELGRKVNMCNFERDELTTRVAAKMLTNAPNSTVLDEDSIKEINIMFKLNHAHVIRFLGVCFGYPNLLVMKYAALASLNIFLKTNPTFPTKQVTNIMHQVAIGMAYLEDNRIVHCCLEARNILLTSSHWAKISNFRYSEILPPSEEFCSLDLSHFQRHLKWMAPECLSHGHANSKSDSWSFGVTFWEAMTYGGMPYCDVTDDEIVDIIQSGRQLSRPFDCPEEISMLMRECWAPGNENRPTFNEIAYFMEARIGLEKLIPYSAKVSDNCDRNIYDHITAICVNSDERPVANVEEEDLIFLKTIKDGGFVKYNLNRFKQHIGEDILVITKLYNVKGNHSSENIEEKIIREADILSRFRHPFLTELIGVCKAPEKIMLITDFVFLGPLNKYLRKVIKPSNCSNERIIKLMYQVAQGLDFLERNGIVHGYVAAKNILLVSEEHAKLTNFSYSKKAEKCDNRYGSMNRNSQRRQNVNCEMKHRKLHLKWLAPESLFCNECSSKSDIWSFGIALWEAMSYGIEPYGRTTVNEIEKTLFHHSDLSKPTGCPDLIYFLMNKCWIQIPKDRPTFRNIVWIFEKIFQLQQIKPFQIACKNQHVYQSLTFSFFTPSNESEQDCLGLLQYGHYVKHKILIPVLAITVSEKAKFSTALTSFIFEAKRLSKLRHNYIARCIGIHFSSERVALLIQSGESGTTLKNLVSENSTIPSSTLIQLMYQIAQGMDYLQNNRILHLNLKASNILLKSDLHAQLGSFRLSKQLESESQIYPLELDQQLAIRWSAPECTTLGVVNFKSDVWSFGTTLWEVLSQGRVPFENFSVDALFERHADIYPIILNKPAICTDNLYKLLLQCCEREIHKRPSFHEIIDMLEQELLQNVMLFVKSENLKFVGDLECGSFGSIKVALYKRQHKRSFVSLNRLEQHPDGSIESDKVKCYLQLLLKIGHEHIVQFFGLSKSENVYVVMELPRLGSLLECTTENPPIPMRHLTHMLQQIVQGLIYLETSRIVHLDLRAESIWLVTRSYVKICNFEFSKELAKDINYCEYEVGKEIREPYLERYRWAAKECLQYNKASNKSDVWSFGVILWEVVSRGARPFENKTENEVRKSILNDIKLMRPHSCAQELYDLMMNCWKEIAEDRPTFTEIEEIIQSISEPFRDDSEHETSFSLKLLSTVSSIYSIDASRLALQHKVLGIGLFGSIKQGFYYLPDDNTYETQVSLKTIQYPDDVLEATTAFVHEFDILSKLRHENIVYCFGISDGKNPMMVLEFAEIGSLDTFLIDHREVITVEQKLNLMHQVSRGMAYIKRRRITHQHLKGANILLTTDITPKITGFEFSVQLDEGKDYCEFTSRKSSLRWTAPECVPFRRFYFKSDVWSFGVILWDVFTYGTKNIGNAAENSSIISSGYGEDDSVFVKNKPQHCSPDLFNLMLSCCKRNLVNRFDIEAVENKLADIKSCCTVE